MENNQETPKTSRGSLLLWLAVAVLAATNIVALWQAGETKKQLARTTQTFTAQLADLREQAEAFNLDAGARAAELRAELEEARRLAATAAGQAKVRAEQMVKRLSEQYEKQQAAISSEIGTVKQAADAAHEKVSAVRTDVEAVRGDVAQTKSEVRDTRSELEATRSELRSVKGDLGVQSGLIATNAKELAALRELGERHYIEFDISKKGQPVKLGNVSVILRKTKPSQSKFTLDIIADDKRVEKKDKTINEPVQFYVTGARQPYELVVNEVRKDAVIGYLSIPKVLRAEAR
jgi:DNA repair exonuclease SbcCD ATPase subunit